MKIKLLSLYEMSLNIVFILQIMFSEMNPTVILILQTWNWNTERLGYSATFTELENDGAGIGTQWADRFHATHCHINGRAAQPP